MLRHYRLLSRYNSSLVRVVGHSAAASRLSVDVGLAYAAIGRLRVYPNGEGEFGGQ